MGRYISSLFKILNFFTEHVQISWANDDGPPEGGSSPSSAYHSPGPHPSPRMPISDRIGPFQNPPHSTSTVVASLLYPGPAPSFKGNTSSTIHPPNAPSPPVYWFPVQGSIAGTPPRRALLHRGVVARAKGIPHLQSCVICGGDDWVG